MSKSSTSPVGLVNLILLQRLRTASFSEIALLLVGAYVAYTVLLYAYRLFLHPLSRVPGSKLSAVSELPLVVAIFGMRRSPATHEAFLKYGPIVRIAPNTVAINTYEAIPEIYGLRTKYEKSPWYKTWRLYNEDATFNMRNNAVNMRRRRVIGPLYSNSALQAVQGKVHSVARDMISYVQSQGQNGAKAINFLTAYRNVSLEMMGAVALNYDFGILKSGNDHPFVHDLDAMIMNGMIKAYFAEWLYFILKKLPFGAVRFIVDSDDRAAQYCIQALDAHKAKLKFGEHDDQESFVTRLADTVDAETGQKLTDSQIIGEVMIQLFGGTDTTSATMTFLTYELARRPDIAEKLFNEVKEVMHDRYAIPEKKDLEALPYLNAFIKEGLRLYCAAPSMLERIVPQGGGQFLGYPLPAGTCVGVQSHSFHQRPDTFPDPLEFNPDRWLKPSEEMDKHFFPFGLGSRICIGMELALMELRTIMCVMSRNFTFRTAPETTPASMGVADMWLAIPVGGKCNLHAYPRDA